MEEDLPLVQVDPPKLKQVLLNLLANAIKFTQSGGRISVFTRLTDSGLLEIEVRDTGIGIKAADMPKILARFGQSEDADRLGKKGTGLGLSITKSLVELHGGTLKIVSRPGSGTRALVQLPTDRVVSEVDDPEPWKILF